MRQPGILHQLNSHDGVVIEKTARVRLIGSDTSDDRRQVENNLGVRLPVESNDALAVAQIILGGARNVDIPAAAFMQLSYDDGT